MNDNTDEIDLIELLKTVWRGKKLIIVISFVFAGTNEEIWQSDQFEDGQFNVSGSK